MGVEASDDHLSVGDVLRTGDPKVARAATVTSGWGEGVDVLPASRNLIDREGDGTSIDAALRLRHALAPMVGDYRYVFVDCAPSLGPTTRAGLAMADRVLLVVELSALSIRGAEAVLETVEEVRSELNPTLDIGGVIVNRAPAVSSEALRQEHELDRLMGRTAVWRPFIPQRTVLNEAVGERAPLHALGYRAQGHRPGVRRPLPPALTRRRAGLTAAAGAGAPAPPHPPRRPPTSRTRRPAAATAPTPTGRPS